MDWETVESSMKKVGNGKQRWTTKHALGNCGVSETLFKWQMQTEKICPLCHNKDEMPEHVFQWNAPVPTQHRRNHLEQLETWMEERKTDPEIIKATMGLRTWTWTESNEETNLHTE